MFINAKRIAFFDIAQRMIYIIIPEEIAGKIFILFGQKEADDKKYDKQGKAEQDRALVPPDSEWEIIFPETDEPVRY